MISPKFRRPLTDKQIYLLKLLYKFRFATRELLAGQEREARSVMHRRLKVLLDQDYIGRNYSNLDRHANRPASYYLMPKAIQLLKNQPGLAQNVLLNAYKDKSAGQAFIDHSLVLFAIYRQMQTLFDDSLRYYSKSEQAAYDHFPEKLPDAYIAVENQEYFLDLIDPDMPNFTIRRRLQSYLEHFEEGSWPEEVYPRLLFICETVGQERRLQRLVSKILVASDDDEVQAYTTTRKALLNAVSKEDLIWTNVNDPEEPINLWPEKFE